MLPSSRDDPDGRSDVSTQSLDVSPLVLSTPPCTPLSAGGDTNSSGVTPLMISAALEALTLAASSSPSDEGQLPECLSQALHNFISEHLCVTPPSTPFEEQSEEHPISSTDLITALTVTLSAHIDTNGGSESGSNIPSVPVGSPQEGSLSELVKLGIQPESLLQALSSFQSKLDESLESETDLLHTITPPLQEEGKDGVEKKKEEGGVSLYYSEQNACRDITTD